MNKKVVVLEILIIVVAITYYIVKIMIPEYRESLGSSDHFLKSSQVENIIEMKIDNYTDFAIVINPSGNIYHMFFFDNSSVALYNKNIESQTIGNGIKEIVSVLKENKIIHNQSQIEIMRTNDEKYDDFQTSWNQALKEYEMNPNVLEKKQDIKQKAIQLGIDTNSYSSMLWELDLYSKEIIKNDSKYKNDILNETTAEEYANNIYKKLEQMVKNNHQDEMPISLIPADLDHQFYPTDRSWYKVENEVIYAFIEMKDENMYYSYCYNGSLNEKWKGEC